MKNIILVFIFLQVVIPQEFVSGCFLSRKQRIYIVNKLPSTSPPLKVHCASHNNDLGTHILLHNQEFDWKFCNNFVGNTLFFCHLWWGSKKVAFEAYKYSSKQSFDKEQTYWTATEAGVIMEDNDDGLSVYNWKN
ncbi:hypothetical protein C2S52_001842 [Perilla frutescens var. hirtella]|nr:hypothetical protein C2S52_001842 [Perilla frutescens var. hirtella]